MKEYKQYGVYGILVKDDKILLIKKKGGPYDKKLDLPGGTIEFRERPIETLKREILEEVGIEVLKFELLDADFVAFEWQYKEDTLINVHHTAIFYKVLDYKNEIKSEITIDSINNDSLGAQWYDISKLKKEQLSAIVILELEKLGYDIKKFSV